MASQPLQAEVTDVSPEVLIAIVTRVVGLISAAALALLNSAITARAGIDEDLRAKRFAALRHHRRVARLAATVRRNAQVTPAVRR
jgi:hypothetical protein